MNQLLSSVSFYMIHSGALSAPLMNQLPPSVSFNMTQFGIFHDFYNNSKEIRDLVDNITTSGALTSRTTSSVETVNKSIDISPNPSSNYLNVDSKFINSNYKIISMNGSTTQTGIINGNRIEIKDLTTGTFIIMIKDRIGNINTAKFLKQ